MRTLKCEHCYLALLSFSFVYTTHLCSVQSVSHNPLKNVLALKSSKFFPWNTKLTLAYISTVHLPSRFSCRLESLLQATVCTDFFPLSLGCSWLVVGCCSGWISGGLGDLFPVVKFTTGFVVQRILCKRFLTKYGYLLHIIIVRKIATKVGIVKYQ